MNLVVDYLSSNRKEFKVRDDDDLEELVEVSVRLVLPLNGSWKLEVMFWSGPELNHSTRINRDGSVKRCIVLKSTTDHTQHVQIASYALYSSRPLNRFTIGTVLKWLHIHLSL